MLRHTTGMPSLDAREDFVRARRGQRLRRLLGGREGTEPRVLCDLARLPRGGTRLKVIPLREIVGTVEPTTAFDARFRPASPLVSARWQRIALAHRTGRSLPPISVLHAPDGYYVVDGRHRVSVALAHGSDDIDAYVTELHVPPTPERRRPAAARLRSCPA
jgi:hypothetical protein